MHLPRWCIYTLETISLGLEGVAVAPMLLLMAQGGLLSIELNPRSVYSRITQYYELPSLLLFPIPGQFEALTAHAASPLYKNTLNPQRSLHHHRWHELDF